jgi:hypothetical protein
MAMANTKPEVRASLGELFDVLNEWDALIECEADAEGFPVGDSLEANVKRRIADAAARTSRIMLQLLIRCTEEAPQESGVAELRRNDLAQLKACSRQLGELKDYMLLPPAVKNGI